MHPLAILSIHPPPNINTNIMPEKKVLLEFTTKTDEQWCGERFVSPDPFSCVIRTG